MTFQVKAWNISLGFPTTVRSDCLLTLKKSCVKVSDKAAVFYHYFLSALLEKKLRPFQIVTLDLCLFISGKGTVPLRQQQML